jgi:HAD superfamily hydrolase (TIGR01490 family)
MMTSAIFDLDGTLCTNPTWKGLARYVKRHRRNRHIHYIFMALHMPFFYLHKARLISEGRARATWARNMTWMLRGMSLAEGHQVFDWIANEYLLPSRRPDVVSRLQEHRARGERVILLSGTFQPLLKIIAAHLGADVALGTQPEQQNGRYTGRALGPACQGEGKAVRLRAYLAEVGNDVDLSASSAYADSIFDLPVLEMVGHPVAVYPDERLGELAMQRGWQSMRKT